jgi:hypothetical protein
VYKVLVGNLEYLGVDGWVMSRRALGIARTGRPVVNSVTQGR